MPLLPTQWLGVSYCWPLMNRIDAIFQDLRARKAKAIMPFICGGYPGGANGSTGDLLAAAERGGASIVEVGYPFSDPIADGPVIAAAMHEALQRGVTPASINAEIAGARASGLRLGVVAMVSVSIVHRIGLDECFGQLKRSGVDGTILPDLPLEEAGDWTKAAAAHGLTASLLVAPTSDSARAAAIVRHCTGFVYVLARAGITGEGQAVATGAIGQRIQQLRSLTDLPLAVGFGISTMEHVRAVVQEAGADAAIVGSALVRHMGIAHGRGESAKASCEAFVRDLGQGLG